MRNTHELPSVCRWLRLSVPVMTRQELTVLSLLSSCCSEEAGEQADLSCLTDVQDEAALQQFCQPLTEACGS